MPPLLMERLPWWWSGRSARTRRLVAILVVVSMCFFVGGTGGTAASDSGKTTTAATTAAGAHPGDQVQVQLQTVGYACYAGRRLLSGGPGSHPPRCTSKCGSCSPCYPVHVSVPPGVFVTTEYYPEAWRCKCRNQLYMP